MKISVYTAIAGNCGDRLLEPLCNCKNVEYYCFTDQHIESEKYKILPFNWTSNDLRRKSRFPKINSHIAFPDSDITIWHDAIYQVKDIEKLINELGDFEFCTFRHSKRTRIAEEAYACILQKKDNPKLIMDQCKYYLSQGMIKSNDLFENSCLVRKNTSKVKEINELWWYEYEKWSCRDQISLPYVFFKLNYSDYTIIKGNRVNNDYFIFREHNSNN